jgi:hypothetical protein
MLRIKSGVEDLRKAFKANYQVSVLLHCLTFASALYETEITLRRTEVTYDSTLRKGLFEKFIIALSVKRNHLLM